MATYPNATPTGPLPSKPAAPTVATYVHSPFSFGVSAHGGTWQDQAAAIIEAMRDLRAAGLIGQVTTESEAA